MLHSLIVQDHYNALLFVTKHAKEKKSVTREFIKPANAAVLKQTGSVYQTVFGELDAAKGVYRKANISAGNNYFAGYQKVKEMVNKLWECIGLNTAVANNVVKQLNICFNAHFNWVTIHPFYNSNGRTACLLMNYQQLYFKLPLNIVFKEDKAAYFETLQLTRKEEDITLFRKFMLAQDAKYLQHEIAKFEQMDKDDSKGKAYSFVF